MNSSLLAWKKSRFDAFRRNCIQFCRLFVDNPGVEEANQLIKSMEATLTGIDRRLMQDTAGLNTNEEKTDDDEEDDDELFSDDDDEDEEWGGDLKWREDHSARLMKR